MNLAGLLLGIINIAIAVAILVIIGLIIVWFASWLGFAVPEQIKKVFMIIVFLVGLGMLVALLLGVQFGPRFISVPFQGVPSSIFAALPGTTVAHL